MTLLHIFGAASHREMFWFQTDWSRPYLILSTIGPSSGAFLIRCGHCCRVVHWMLYVKDFRLRIFLMHHGTNIECSRLKIIYRIQPHCRQMFIKGHPILVALEIYYYRLIGPAPRSSLTDAGHSSLESDFIKTTHSRNNLPCTVRF